MKKKKAKKTDQPERKRRPVPTSCPVCDSKVEPDYKSWQALEKFITDRKKIVNRTRTGVCSKHQKRLAREIKRARYLALLPFSVKI